MTLRRPTGIEASIVEARFAAAIAFIQRAMGSVSKNIFELRRVTASVVVVASLFSMHAFSDGAFVENAKLPVNGKNTCSADINSWFASGRATVNGWVAPANSLDPIFANSKNNTRCDFYRWGAQMFLWLTSGIDDRHVFSTPPVFYNVSVESDGKRNFVAQVGPLQLTVRKSKTDEEIELGQAGNSDVLISQNGSLVYYGIHANDVYALYTTGQKNGAFNGSNTLKNNFPHSWSQLRMVDDYAIRYGYPLGWEKIALAMEVKTSWVDASTVSNEERYVLTKAIVPTFDRSKPKGPWPVSGAVEKTLALVGMHVVGTVDGHPEMIWSTFEHVNNVADNDYLYTNNAGQNSTRPYSSSGTHWTFLAEGAGKPSSIVANAKVRTDTGGSTPTQIVNVDGRDIAPINNFRFDPWGSPPGSSADASAIGNNTDLISINVSVLSQLQAGDIRGNYIQTGGIWTSKGQIPPDGKDKALVGSLRLANTTMETFYQIHNPNGFNPENCFGCHGTSDSKVGTNVSHIFDDLQALPQE